MRSRPCRDAVGGLSATAAPLTPMPAAYLTDSLARLTADGPRVAGLIKQRPEDFRVEELPLYEPCGEGEHLYLLVEKRNQTTSDVVWRIAKMFRVRRGDVGYAGLKDKHAVTRQHFSVHLPSKEDEQQLLSRFEFTPFTLLWAKRHTNKLRRGHLAGNRFAIRIRGAQVGDVVRIKTAMDQLAATGAANYFGPQRFGYMQSNHLLGKLMLQGRWQEMLDLMLGPTPGRPPEAASSPAGIPQPRQAGPEQRRGRDETADLAGRLPTTLDGRIAYSHGDYLRAMQLWPKYMRQDRQALDVLRQGRTPRDAVVAIDAQHRRFLISAIQSAIFNHVLDHRIRAGRLHQLVAGDLAWKYDSHAVFAVDQATADLENAAGGRVEALAVGPSGPMWGCGMSQPGGEVLQQELAALEAFGMTPQDFRPLPDRGAVSEEGRRRPMRMTVRDPQVAAGADEHGPYIHVGFELARGCFATTVLREFLEPGADDANTDAGDDDD